MDRRFTVEAIHMANKHMKNMIRIIIVSKMQIKIIKKTFYIVLQRTIKMAQWKVVTSPDVAEDAEKMHHSYIAGGNVKQTATLEKHMAVSYRIKHDPAIALLGIYPKERKIYVIGREGGVR